jgi:hypothetical protein
MSNYQRGDEVLVEGITARVRAVQVDPVTGHVFYSVELWPDTPDRQYMTVSASEVN